jgi:putative membrane protein
MWPYMGWWMVLWWGFGLAVLVLFVWLIAKATAGTSGRSDDTPEQILKRRYARGEIDRDEYQRRLADLRH